MEKNYSNMEGISNEINRIFDNPMFGSDNKVDNSLLPDDNSIRLESNKVLGLPEEVQITDKDVTGVKFSCGYSKDAINLTAMVIIEFISSDILLYNDPQLNQFFIQIKNASDLENKVNKIIGSFDRDYDYKNGLGISSLLKQLFLIFDKTYQNKGVIRLGIKKRDNTSSIAVQTQQVSLVDAFSRNMIVLDENNGIYQVKLQVSDEDELASKLINVNNYLDNSGGLFSNEKGLTGQIPLIIITLLELVAVAISFYFIYF